MRDKLASSLRIYTPRVMYDIERLLASAGCFPAAAAVAVSGVFVHAQDLARGGHKLQYSDAEGNYQ